MDRVSENFEPFEGSTDVVGICYDEGATYDLTVYFARGVVYCYKQVPPDIVALFRAANSKGRFVGKYLRGKYKFERVESGGESVS